MENKVLLKILLFVSVLSLFSSNCTILSMKRKRDVYELENPNKETTEKDKKKKKVNPIGNFGTLISAIKKGDILDVKDFFFKYTFNIETRGENNGFTPLLYAANEGKLDIFKYLLEKGADINNTFEDCCENVLHFAITSGNLELVKFIVENLKNLNAKFDLETEANYLTAVLWAANRGKLGIFKYLLKQGSNINAVNSFNRNAIHLAIESSNLELVKFIVENLEKLNAKFNLKTKDDYAMTPLLYAASEGKLDIFKYLLLKKSNINAVDRDDCNALHLACYSGNLKLVKFIVENLKKLGARFDIETKTKSGETPLLLAAKKGKLDILQYLLQKKANINATDNRGNNVLHLACCPGNLKLVKFIVENLKKLHAKFGIETKNNLGYTPLSYNFNPQCTPHIIEYLKYQTFKTKIKNKTFKDVFSISPERMEKDYQYNLNKLMLKNVFSTSPETTENDYQYNLTKLILKNEASVKDQNGQNFVNFLNNTKKKNYIYMPAIVLFLLRAEKFNKKITKDNLINKNKKNNPLSFLHKLIKLAKIEYENEQNTLRFDIFSSSDEIKNSKTRIGIGLLKKFARDLQNSLFIFHLLNKTQLNRNCITSILSFSSTNFGGKCLRRLDYQHKLEKSINNFKLF